MTAYQKPLAKVFNAAKSSNELGLMCSLGRMKPFPPLDDDGRSSKAYEYLMFIFNLAQS